MTGISAQELSQRIPGPATFTLLDVRKTLAVQSSGGKGLPGAQWLDPARWLDWKDEVPSEQPVVVYCAHGMEISQALTTALSVMGRDAVYLTGGYGAWVEAGLPTETLPKPSP